jgi:hypothetical protein
MFFDEADALFGKRSEVRDSHDRYANIEIEYLRSSVPTLAFFNDGHAVSVIGGQHWSFARQLLNSVFPRPSHDEMVRQWYLATTASMLTAHEKGAAPVLLDRTKDFAHRIWDQEILPTSGRHAKALRSHAMA